MKRFLTLALLLLMSACAPMLAPATEPPNGASILALETATRVPPTFMPTASLVPTEAATSTPAPRNPEPTATETMQPAPVLPTPEAVLPAIRLWMGEPSYPADSEPGMVFLIRYDPEMWTPITDDLGGTSLAYRPIEYCMITPYTGRGLPPGWTVESESREIGGMFFEVLTASENGEVKFVNYLGGDRRIYTAFQLTFAEEREACQQAAENLLATLRSFPATPTPNP
jgi:hypothetical protein